ncbi:MAG: hypothetical protein N2112_04945 [Gemmataceae bacterium]|jgi:hypothetical protein|nr:hypothetical protein [Gemmataceae bacterium]
MRFRLTLFVFVWLVPYSYAHRLIVEAKPAPGSVKIEAYYFEDDTPAQKAKVTLLKNNLVIKSGLTDERGVCTLDVNESGEILVKVESIGHAAKTTFIAIPSASIPSSINPDSGSESSPSLPISPIGEEGISPPSKNLDLLNLPTWLRVGLGWGIIAAVSGLGYFLLKLRSR